MPKTPVFLGFSMVRRKNRRLLVAVTYATLLALMAALIIILLSGGSADKIEALAVPASATNLLCNDGGIICVSQSVEHSLISGPLDVTVQVNSSGQIGVGWKVADSTGQVLESESTYDYNFPFQTESESLKTLRIKDYVLQPSKSDTGTLTLSPSRFDPSSGKTDLPELKIPVRLDTATTVLTILLPKNRDDFIGEAEEWTDNQNHGEFAPKSPLIQHTVTVMRVNAEDIIGATAEAAARAWPSTGVWHVIDLRMDGYTAHVTLMGEGWAGVTYYLTQVDFIIEKSLLRLPGVKRVIFESASSP